MTYEMYACYVYLKPKRLNLKESVYTLNVFIFTFKNSTIGLFHQLGIGLGNIEKKNQQFTYTSFYYFINTFIYNIYTVHTYI